MKDLEPEQPYPGVSSRVRAVIDMYGPSNLLTRQEVTREGEPTGVVRDANTPEVLGATRTEPFSAWAPRMRPTWTSYSLLLLFIAT